MSCCMEKNKTNTCQRDFFKLYMYSLFNLWNEDSDFEITTYNYFLNLPTLNFKKPKILRTLRKILLFKLYFNLNIFENTCTDITFS